MLLKKTRLEMQFAFAIRQLHHFEFLIAALSPTVPGSLRSPESALKCLFGLAYIARAIFEPGEFLQEGQRDLAHRAVTLLGNN
jgi:hypothetical protein